MNCCLIAKNFAHTASLWAIVDPNHTEEAYPMSSMKWRLFFVVTERFLEFVTWKLYIRLPIIIWIPFALNHAHCIAEWRIFSNDFNSNTSTFTQMARMYAIAWNEHMASVTVYMRWEALV